MVKFKIPDCNYSLDMLIIDFVMRKKDVQLLQMQLSFITTCYCWTSNKISSFRFQYSIKVDMDDNSFWVGIQKNNQNTNDVITVRIEFNPNKVGDNDLFKQIYFMIYQKGSKFIKVKRFDLAIDIPVDRDRCYLVKDKRTYQLYKNSSLDKTEYLGSRSNHGFVKLYNKALELKLKDVALTRLELTIDYDKRFEHKIIFPEVKIIDNLQFDIDLTGTDKVLLIACLGDMCLLNELPQVKKKKIRDILGNISHELKFDVKKYDVVLDLIRDYIDLN